MADSSYYLYDFWLYQGKESERIHKPLDIVVDFVKVAEQNTSGLPFIVVADSYYGSANLATQLHDMGHGYLLSCKADMPSYIFSDYLHLNIKKQTWFGMNNSTMSAVTAFDKAKVNLLTNLFLGDTAIANAAGTKQIPQSLYYYRMWLGAVDHFDRQLHLYLSGHRNIKWHQALLGGLLKIAVNNTWVIYKELGHEITLKDTILAIIEYLGGDHSLRKEANRPAAFLRYDGLYHYPASASKQRCAQCLSNGTASNTSYKCSKCDVHLHPLCFETYHKN